MIRISLPLRSCLGLLSAALVASASAQLARKEADLGNDPAWIKKAAGEIDKRIGTGFQKAKVTATAPADDSRWLRRVYLDATGRIPSYPEAKAFLDDSTPDKREKLVEKLLNSEGYVSQMYNYFCDLFRATSRLGDGTRSGVPYLRWIRESAASNKSWDIMTAELLTSSGGGWEEGKGAVGYFERDRGMPLDNMANTTRIFLGTHIECAQCHDHPYDKWKQTDFYEMAAFTHGMNTGSGDERKKFVNEQYNGKNENPDAKKREIYRWLMDNIYDFGVAGGGDGVIKLPMDFKGKGGKPDELVKAKSLFPGARNGSPKPIDDGREKFAKWVTDPANPRFSMLIANRMWKRVMGIGLFEPVDKFIEGTRETPGTVISNPAVMEYLQSILRESNFDLKTFQKVLFNTRTYALGTNTNPVDPRMPYAFQGRAVRRMNAEQVWDSIATLVVPDIDYRKGNALNPSAVVGGRNLGRTVYDVYKEVINFKPAEISAWVDKVVTYTPATKGGDSMMMMDNMMSAKDPAAAATSKDAARWAGYSNDLIRASELSAPTPPEHFLRKFGQSSREIIEGGSSESDVTQILSLINGHVEKNIVAESKAVVYKAIDAAAAPEDKVKAAFLAILTRYPTPAELDLLLPEAKKGREGIKNILYALLNSNEFIFIL
ncbi:MAG: Protein of unknown function (DUF1549)/Protein of unknown function (DUF1553) [Verrucomicrobia bacterium]|nr:MAG: Protein of unknown function (DUF1549)/Protein of unknown function (DUF1553) [Verrucomicrobiota bacterium]